MKHSPDFTELFLTKSSTRPRLLFTVQVDGKLFFYSSPQPQNPDDNSTLVATRYHTSFPNVFHSDNCSTVCGLALLDGVTKRKERAIWNPITGELLTLPKVLLENKTLPEVEAKANVTKAKEIIEEMYLGYDPIGKQFKVLCMTSSVDERGERLSRPTAHQVLTFDSGKRLWRRIEYEFHFEECCMMSGEMCINGVLYFGAKMGQFPVIVCFDVGSEKFGFINLDKDMMGEGDDCYNVGCLILFNYKGKLGIRKETTTTFRERDQLVLWVLEDAGNHKWSKQTYVLPPLISGESYFVGMNGTGDTVFSPYSYSYGGSKLFYVDFYNLERGTFTRINVHGFEEFENPLIRIFLDYVENLKFF